MLKSEIMSFEQIDRLRIGGELAVVEKPLIWPGGSRVLTFQPVGRLYVEGRPSPFYCSPLEYIPEDAPQQQIEIAEILENFACLVSDLRNPTRNMALGNLRNPAQIRFIRAYGRDLARNYGDGFALLTAEDLRELGEPNLSTRLVRNPELEFVLTNNPRLVARSKELLV